MNPAPRPRPWLSSTSTRSSEANRMKISWKLYINFGLILALVILLCIVNLAAVHREHQARAASVRAAQIARSGEAVRHQLMQNRLHLSNYLLSGDGRELQKVEDGVSTLQNLLRAAQDG